MRPFFKNLLPGSLLISLLIAASPLPSLAVILDVAIKKNFDVIDISSSAPVTITSKCDKEKRVQTGIIRISNLTKGFLVGGKLINCDDLLFSSQNPISVAGSLYMGSMRLIKGKTRGALLINKVELENYVNGVIGSEMAPGWPLEALKAQAVASRSYALYKVLHPVPGKMYHLENTTASQVYTGLANSRSNVPVAVEATRGLVAVFNSEVAETFFHSSAGGKTADITEVWGGGKRPYLISRPSLFEHKSPSDRWMLVVKKADLRKSLQEAGYDVGPLHSIRLGRFTRSGRANSVTIRHYGKRGKLTISGTEFRHLVGYRKLKSTRFSVYPGRGKTFMFRGRGYGHGVGMSQWSARGMAERGRNFTQIIKHFYRGVEIVRIENLKLPK